MEIESYIERAEIKSSKASLWGHKTWIRIGKTSNKFQHCNIIFENLGDYFSEVILLYTSEYIMVSSNNNDALIFGYHIMFFKGWNK